MSDTIKSIKRIFNCGETSLCYFEWGNPSDQTILMVHATGFHARCWDRAIAALPAGYHVIAVDQSGHGRSYKPDTLADWSVMGDDLARLVTGLELNNVIGVGHSMGGHTLVQIAAQMQGRFERLVLIDPTITEPDAYQNPPVLDEIDASQHPVARRRGTWNSPQQMFDAFKDRHPFNLWWPDVLMDYCQYGLLLDGESYELACPPYLEASVYAGFQYIDPYPMVALINLETLIIRAQTGNTDKDAPLDFANSPTWPGLANKFKNAREIHIPELSHFMPMQDPERIAGLIVTG